MSDTDWFEGCTEELNIMHDDDPKSTRWGVKLVLALLAFILAGAVASRCEAAEIFRSTDDRGGQMTLRLYEDKCANESVNAHLVRLKVAPEYIAQFKRAMLFYWGREWASCWFEQDGRIYSVDEHGDPLQPIPRRLFQQEGV